MMKSNFNYTLKNGTITITGYTGPSGTVIIPSVINGLAVTSIGNWAFSECHSLTSITIPNSVTSIGDGAFRNCTSLSAITVDALNPAYISVGGVLFNQSQTVLIEYPAGKAGSQYTIPNSVSSIGNSAFGGCTSPTSITIPNSVTSIGVAAFGGCTSMTSVTIPDSVTYIGGAAFASCTSLISITIPNSVTSIGDYAFQSCYSLTSVTLPDSVRSIEDWVFAGCTSLTNIAIPISVTSIGDYAFNGCTSLARVTIGNGVTSIGNSVFSGCTQLPMTAIRFLEPIIGKSAFPDTCKIINKEKIMSQKYKLIVVDVNDSINSKITSEVAQRLAFSFGYKWPQHQLVVRHIMKNEVLVLDANTKSLSVMLFSSIKFVSVHVWTPESLVKALSEPEIECPTIESDDKNHSATIFPESITFRSTTSKLVGVVTVPKTFIHKVLKNEKPSMTLPLAGFSYPSSDGSCERTRYVKVVRMDEDYIQGFEITNSFDINKEKGTFKKYSMNKVRGEVHLYSFLQTGE